MLSSANPIESAFDTPVSSIGPELAAASRYGDETIRQHAAVASR